MKLVKKVELIKAPSIKKELSCFVGLVNFFGRYINNFTEIVRPLNNLRKKNSPFVWGKAQQVAFDKLKKLLSAYLIVKIFDSTKNTTLINFKKSKAKLKSTW